MARLPVSVIVAFMVIAGIAKGGLDALLSPVEGTITAQIVEGLSFAAASLTMFAWVRFKERRPVSSLGFRGGAALPRFALGLAMGAGMQSLTVALLLLLGQYEPWAAPPVGATVGWGALVPALLLVLMWTVQSSTEELISRGFQVQWGALQLPGWLALLLPGLVFSGLHFVSDGLSHPLAIVNILFFALFASFVALRQGSLWMVCGVHAGWNWFQGNIFGVPVSGGAIHHTVLYGVAPKANAADWLSGGSFGPEGSFLVLIIWGLAMVAAYYYFRSAQHSPGRQAVSAPSKP